LLRIFAVFSCSAFVFVAMRHLFEETAQSGVMHLFVGRKLEMKKPRGYLSRRELVAKLVAYVRGFLQTN
jgi:hypothetical protein